MPFTNLINFLKRKITRRCFLKTVTLSTLGATLGPTIILKPRQARAATPQNRVVRVYDENATYWNGNEYDGNPENAYWDKVNQDIVYSMVEMGICNLVGTTSLSSAWQQIMSSYTPGDKICIKVNFNNHRGTPQLSNIDATIYVINGILKGLIEYVGVSEGDIKVYDAVRYIPDGDRFKGKCDYNISYGDASTGDGWTDSEVNFTTPPEGPGPFNLSKILEESQHLINVPLLKYCPAGITGVFKNHYGTVRHCGYLHNYSDGHHFCDLNNHPQIRNKTRLFVGDGLFGAWDSDEKPRYWSNFGNKSPNSIFFSINPVAIESVMLDYVLDVKGFREHQFLEIAGLPPYNLGIHEHYHGDHEYYNIEYLTNLGYSLREKRKAIDQKIKEFKEGTAEQSKVEEKINDYMQH